MGEHGHERNYEEGHDESGAEADDHGCRPSNVSDGEDVAVANGSHSEEHHPDRVPSEHEFVFFIVNASGME